MVKTDQETIIYENKIEDLFYEYCIDNNLQEDLEKRNINDNDAHNIWKYIYKRLFKPDLNTIRYNNKSSKLDYNNIYLLHEILDIYIDLCFKYKILPMISDYSKLTGITTETLYSWEREEYRQEDEGAIYKHSDLIKKIRAATQEMGIKDLHGNTLGQQSLANNYKEMGLNFTKNAAIAQANYARIAIDTEAIKARYAKIVDQEEVQLPNFNIE